jgi:acetyl esterase/lipase
MRANRRNLGVGGVFAEQRSPVDRVSAGTRDAIMPNPSRGFRAHAVLAVAVLQLGLLASAGAARAADEAPPARPRLRDLLKQRAAGSDEAQTPDAGRSLLSSAVPDVKGVAYAHRAKDPVRNQLDVYLPAESRKRGADWHGHPVVIWVHGGAWKFGDKTHVGLKPDAFAERGFALVATNYRFVPETTFRGQAEDVASAVAWTRSHIAEHGGDPDRVYLMGHSAGAHLAALVATDPRYLAAEKETLAAVKGVILLDGAGYEVASQLQFGGERIRKLYEEAFGTSEADWAEASPVLRVKQAPAGTPFPPFLIHHVAGRLDSRRQSHLLADAVVAAGGRAEVYAAEGKSHMTINREFGLDDDAVTEKTWTFLAGGEKK